MKFCFALIAALMLPIGCGDNSDECGPGTHAVDGVCTPDGTTTCSDGTKLDSSTGTCVVDPNDCQDGTVLVGTQCVDPGHVTADVEEAAEPNGEGLFGEMSNGPAGSITLKPVGEHFVVHGKIKPFEDADNDGQLDPDIDTYLMSVSGPTLISVSADGLHGLAGGFLSVAAVSSSSDPLANWERIGANLTGDMSKRQVYLPAAGEYAIAVTDSRTLILNDLAPAGAADGQPDFEYYMTVDAMNIPAPTALAVDAGQASSTGTLDPGVPKFFTVPMGTGFNTVTYDDDSTLVTESLVITNTRGAVLTVKDIENGDPKGDSATAPSPATGTGFGLRPTDTTLVVADEVVDYANAPTNYSLTIAVADAGQLSTTGGDSTVTTDSSQFTPFYYDVASDNEFTGMNVVFDRAVSGVVVDDNLFIFSYFTYDPLFGFQLGDTFTTYQGVLREQKAGRYYFLVFDPNATTATSTITATSTYAAMTPVAVTEGTTTASQATNTYLTNLFTYDAGTTDPWQQFAASHPADSRFYAPADAYGRLSPFQADATCFDTPQDDFCGQDSAPLWAPTLDTTPAGRILLDDGTTNYVVLARPSQAFTLTFSNQPHTDLAPVGGGAAVTDHGTYDLTNTSKRYLIKTTAGSPLTISATPNAVTDAVIDTLDNVENVTASINAGGINQAEHLEKLTGAHGWAALELVSNVPAVAQAIDLSVTAAAPITYTKSAGTTAFTDVCATGTTVAMSDTDEGMSNATLSAPAGFALFGIPSPTFNVFANGFLSFDTNLACPGSTCFFSPEDLPTQGDPTDFIAPFWGDLVVTNVCTKTTGTKVVVQWDGTPYLETAEVHFQAILDGSNNTIELVYAATHDAANDGSEDTIGLDSAESATAFKVGYLQSVVTPATSILLTPN